MATTTGQSAMAAMMHVSATIETMNASSACGPAIQADEALMKAGTSAIRTIHSTRVNVRRTSSQTIAASSTSAFAITGPYPPRVPSASDTAMPIGDHSRYSSSTTRRRPCGPDVASSMTSRRQPPARALSVAAMSQYPRSPARSALPPGQAIIGTCTSITGSMRSKMSSRLVPVTVMPWFLSPTTACDGSCSSRMMSATATASSAVPQG